MATKHCLFSSALFAIVIMIGIVLRGWFSNQAHVRISLPSLLPSRRAACKDMVTYRPEASPPDSSHSHPLHVPLHAPRPPPCPFLPCPPPGLHRYSPLARLPHVHPLRPRLHRPPHPRHPVLVAHVCRGLRCCRPRHLTSVPFGTAAGDGIPPAQTPPNWGRVPPSRARSLSAPPRAPSSPAGSSARARSHREAESQWRACAPTSPAPTGPRRPLAGRSLLRLLRPRPRKRRSVKPVQPWSQASAA